VKRLMVLETSGHEVPQQLMYRYSWRHDFKKANEIFALLECYTALIST
jgi:hypothetical protein